MVPLVTSASPRLRGWTQPLQLAPEQPRGFPAPAGMDPPPALASSTARRLPRACGDGPTLVCLYLCADGASPRLRGWTAGSKPGSAGSSGFPAPAGMDPDPAGPRQGAGGLPRACGDGPERGGAWVRRATASPRLRGWTPLGGAVRLLVRGFPAPAGMDPAPSASPPSSRRLPRACGDGPRHGAQGGDRVRASPRLRGWTRHPLARMAQQPGFPAPAGMDPCRSRSPMSARRLPRACGDGPVLSGYALATGEASPRLRGWTPH